MFKLNFKENIKDLLKGQVDEIVSKEVEPEQAENITKKEDYNNSLLHTDKYLELIELINLNSKAAIVAAPQPKTNLFSAKSVVTVAAFLLTSVLVQLDNALLDRKVSYSEGVGIAIAFIGAISTVAARGAEGKEGVFTPEGLPGLNKKDFNNDGLIDVLDITQ
jgi:hypothetical protein